MNDFALHIAKSEKFPRFIFGLEALDPTILIYFTPTPRRVKCTIC